MRAINLLPGTHVIREGRTSTLREANVTTIGGGAAVVLCALLAGLLLVSSSDVSSKRDELAVLQAEKTELSRRAQEPQRAALIAERRARESALASALSSRIAWDRILRRLARVLPRDVWVSGITTASPTSTTAAGSVAAPSAPGVETVPTGFNLRGFAPSQQAVARTIARLAVLPDLSDVQLVSSTETVLEKRRVLDFTIAANVRPSGDSR
ncbi:MAG: PilN domain-containing protein [Actinobacteria bacterium]|nr:PilN domain-containing protein [Actinomycetota bacterium]